MCARADGALFEEGLGELELWDESENVEQSGEVQGKVSHYRKF